MGGLYLSMYLTAGVVLLITTHFKAPQRVLQDPVLNKVGILLMFLTAGGTLRSTTFVSFARFPHTSYNALL
jgi:hypothetical protein